MNTAKMTKQCAAMLGAGETIVAATKAMPRGAVNEVILGAAGAVAGGTVAPVAAGVGAVLGSKAGESLSEAGRDERTEAGLDVGNASHVLLAVTDRRVALFAINAFGKPKELTAAIGRDRITAVTMGQTKVFGQSMAEIVLALDTGAEVGFGVAKVHRKHGDAVVAALG
ncbi:MAG: hypothetical protein DHS20C19_03860 [Acidimicrobiales bacterium]|nr:MAG: hypothetical protein DHS20C19_03860 [Acidimicrobiales bacterium]